MESSFGDSRGVNRFATLIGYQLEEMKDGKSVITLDLREDHFHPGGMVHGGVAYGMVDTGMAMAVISTLDSGQGPVTIEIKISYLEAVRDGQLRCNSSIIRRGKRVAFLESKVHEGERLVATATGSFAIFAV